jgi:hypothetical protein
MATSSVVIALAGGIGAAVGASSGQLVQWWREQVRTGIEERRRQEDRGDVVARERRDHKRSGYVELGGRLQAIIDYDNLITPTIFRVSLAPQVEWADNPAMEEWSSYYVAMLDQFTHCRSISVIYGSPEVRRAVQFLGATLRGLAPPQPLSDPNEYYIHALNAKEQGVEVTLPTVQPSGLTSNVLESSRVVTFLVEWTIGQLRFELMEGEEPNPLPFRLEFLSQSIPADESS